MSYYWRRREVITLLSCLTLALGMTTTLAWPQQMVMPADLVGAVMEISVTNDRVVRRDGTVFKNRFQTDWTIQFVSEQAIRTTFVGTDYGPRGTTTTPAEEGRLVILGKRTETPTQGGGYRMWTFDAGALAYLRTFESGAMKGTFTVARSGASFNCTASVSWPRETDAQTIILRSFVDNARVEIVSAKQTASSCKISKP